MHLAILVSHPIQYYGPLFREIARRIAVTVFFAHRATPHQQATAGFDTPFIWDVDLLEGYNHTFLCNVASDPGTHHFRGCDTPEIAQVLSSGRFNALLVMGWHLKSYLQAAWAAKSRGIPVLVRGDSHLGTPRGIIKRLVKEATYPAFLRVFDAALYVGQLNRAYYEHYGYPTERLFYSPHCVDNDRFALGATREVGASFRSRLGIGPDDNVVLFAGKLVALKRPLDLIEAAAIVRQRGDVPLHIIVAGSGPLEQEMRARAIGVNVPLHLLGFQNQTQMPAAYAAADTLALTSTGETWGLVCNEALACGVPIIVSDAVGCAPDLAADGKVGRTFPVGDVHSLAEAISSLLCSPPSRTSVLETSERHSFSAAISGLRSAVERVARSTQ